MRKKVDPSKIVRGVKFYSVEDLVEILELTPGAVRDYLRKSKIEAIKIGLRWWVSEKSLSNFLMCKGIRNLPDSEFILMINKAVEIRYKAWTDEAVPLIQKTVKAFLLERKIESDLKKVDEKNKQFSGRAGEHLKRRTEEAKKELEEAKQL